MKRKPKMTEEEAIEHLIKVGYLRPQKSKIWWSLAAIYPKMQENLH